MLDINDFNFFESNTTSFDIKGFLTRLLSGWKWILASLIICFVIAYNINVRKEKIYGMEASIVVKDENNSFFTSNTSLVFNWGGVSEKVQTIITTLNSRTHNEYVVKKLQYYINYYQQGKYNLIDVYGQTPFYITLNENKGQLLGELIKINFISPTEYRLSVDFSNKKNYSLVHYIDNSRSSFTADTTIFEKVYKVGELVKLPFLELTLHLQPEITDFDKTKEYIISLADFNGTVSRYRGMGVSVDNKAKSVITLSLQGTNKNRLVEYLNTTITVLKTKQLENKNKFATNTISFIDSTLTQMEGQLKEAENELKNFRKGKNVYQIEGGGEALTEKLSDYDIQKDEINRKIRYLDHLKSYLLKSNDYSKLPAPSVAGIDDGNIVANVSKLIQLSTQREELSYSVKSDVYFSDFDSEMDAVKNVLLENIESAKSATRIDLNIVNQNIARAEGQVSVLPEQQQEHLKITRKYNLKDNIYNTFLQKRAEAEIIKASNVSDVEFIDSAKDIGGGLRGPKTSVNYIMAALFGFLVPFVIIFILALFDNNINTTEDIVKQTKIPLIGVVGKKYSETNLAVMERPKSPIAESFRAIRSSLQFLYKRQGESGAKTVMLTSSVSGEGKTFCSINLATVFALSDKKTVLVGLDLRKPKIFGDFNIDNKIGVVNYLIGQKSLEEITQESHISNLDIISSGPIPPNPSELLMSSTMEELISKLKEKYDYIVLDTPPVGLVSDALELSRFCDATLYVTRQGFTKKGMLSVVNEKHKRGELHNISIVLNGYQNKAKYGYGYGYGYNYGYGAYGESYLDTVREESWWQKVKKNIIKK